MSADCFAPLAFRFVAASIRTVAERGRAGTLRCALLLAGCMLATPSGSIPVALRPLPDLVQWAPAICVGAVTSVSPWPGKGESSFGGSHGAAAVYTLSANFTIEKQIKGSALPKRIRIEFPKRAPGPGVDEVEYTDLRAGERVMVFLDSGPGSDVRNLFEPASYRGPKIPLGSTTEAHLNPANTPLRRVLSYLVGGLAGDAQVKLACLRRIAEIGPLLHGGANTAERQLRSYLHEGADLEELVNDQIAPAVLKLRADRDPEVRVQALVTAGALQMPAAILPLCAEMAERPQPEIAAVLSQYRNRLALTQLISALDSRNADIREAAAHSLRVLGDRASVPFLVLNLDDPDPGVRYMVVTALDASTGNAFYPSIPAYKEREEEYLGRWKRWAQEHAAELERERRLRNVIPLEEPLPDHAGSWGDPVLSRRVKVGPNGPTFVIRLYAPMAVSGHYYHVAVYSEDESRLLQSFEMRNGVPLQPGTDSFEVLDVDHDGLADLRVLGGTLDRRKWYKVWRYDPHADRFEWYGNVTADGLPLRTPP